MKASIHEIATALGVSKQRTRVQAARELWPYTETPVRGGRKREYEVARLPKAVREALQARRVSTALQTIPAHDPANVVALRPNGLPALAPRFGLDELNERERRALNAATVVARYALQVVAESNGSVRAAAQAVEDAAREGRLPKHIAIELAAAQLKPRANRVVSARTVRRWIETYVQGAAAGDTGQALVRSNRKVSAGIIHGGNAWWAMALLRRYCVPSRPPVTEAWTDARTDLIAAGHEEATLPAYSAAARLIKALPVTVKERGRLSGAALRAKLPFVKRDTSALFANDAWVGDGHTFKARVAHPDHGQAFQPEVTLVVDWATRFIVGWSVSLSENVIAVADSLRDAVRRTQCKPLIYYSDNGSGQTAKLLDAPIVGICERIGIAHETGIPGNPQGRGVIERLWQTVTIPLARKYATVLTKTADRDMVRRVTQEIAKAQRAGETYRGLPSWNQFLADLQGAVDDYNTGHQHRELGRMTPAEAFAERIAPYSVVKPTPRELAEMFMPEVVRTCSRGVIRLHGNTYFNAGLVNLLADKEQVRVGFDIHDPNGVVVKRMDGTVLCNAAWDGHARSAFPVAYIDLLRQQRVDDARKRLQARIDTAEAELTTAIEGELVAPDIELSTPVAAKPVPEKTILDFLPEKPVEQEREMSHQELTMWLYGPPSASDESKDEGEAEAAPKKAAAA